MKSDASRDAELYGSVGTGLAFAFILTSVAYERLAGAVKRSAKDHVIECKNRMTLFAFFGALFSAVLSLNGAYHNA